MKIEELDVAFSTKALDCIKAGASRYDVGISLLANAAVALTGLDDASFEHWKDVCEQAYRMARTAFNLPPPPGPAAPVHVIVGLPGGRAHLCDLDRGLMVDFQPDSAHETTCVKCLQRVAFTLVSMIRRGERPLEEIGHISPDGFVKKGAH